MELWHAPHAQGALHNSMLFRPQGLFGKPDIQKV